MSLLIERHVWRRGRLNAERFSSLARQLQTRLEVMTIATATSLAISQSFDECQKANVFHRKNFTALSQTLFSSPQHFTPPFLSTLNKILAVKKKEASSDRCLQFISSFVAFLWLKQGEILFDRLKLIFSCAIEDTFSLCRFSTTRCRCALHRSTHGSFDSRLGSQRENGPHSKLPTVGHLH